MGLPQGGNVFSFTPDFGFLMRTYQVGFVSRTPLYEKIPSFEAGSWTVLCERVRAVSGHQTA